MAQKTLQTASPAELQFKRLRVESKCTFPNDLRENPLLRFGMEAFPFSPPHTHTVIRLADLVQQLTTASPEFWETC